MRLALCSLCSLWRIKAQTSVLLAGGAAGYWVSVWALLEVQLRPILALLLWRFLPTEGDPGCPGLEVAEVVAGKLEVEEGACCWDTFWSSAASCLGSTPGDLGGLLPKGATQTHKNTRVIYPDWSGSPALVWALHWRCILLARQLFSDPVSSHESIIEIETTCFCRGPGNPGDWSPQSRPAC